MVFIFELSNRLFLMLLIELLKLFTSFFNLRSKSLISFSGGTDGYNLLVFFHLDGKKSNKFSKIENFTNIIKNHQLW